jgi:hypothetical protein
MVAKPVASADSSCFMDLWLDGYKTGADHKVAVTPWGALVSGLWLGQRLSTRRDLDGIRRREFSKTSIELHQGRLHLPQLNRVAGRNMQAIFR